MGKFVNNKMSMEMEPWIETSLGEKFWYTADDTSGIEIQDIAAALSKICRFTGHGKFFYSVAEHSINVAFLLPKEKRLMGLLHDASEAFLSDIASPAKQLLPDYKNLEQRIMSRIAKRFDLPDKFWEDPEIKLADWSQLKEEAKYLLPSKGENWYFPPDLKHGILPIGYPSSVAELLFLDVANQYQIGLQNFNNN